MTAAATTTTTTDAARTTAEEGNDRHRVDGAVAEGRPAERGGMLRHGRRRPRCRRQSNGMIRRRRRRRRNPNFDGGRAGPVEGAAAAGRTPTAAGAARLAGVEGIAS